MQHSVLDKHKHTYVHTPDPCTHIHTHIAIHTRHLLKINLRRLRKEGARAWGPFMQRDTPTLTRGRGTIPTRAEPQHPPRATPPRTRPGSCLSPVAFYLDQADLHLQPYIFFCRCSADGGEREPGGEL